MNRALKSTLGLLLAACALPADDWPMLGGHPDRNSVSSEKGLPTVWSWEDAKKKTPRKNIKWVAKLGAQTWSNPVVSGGRIFIGTSADSKEKKDDRGVLLCLSAADGTVLWQKSHEKLYPEDNTKAMEEDYPQIGLTSTPCVAGDRVFYVSNRNELVCRGVQDGSQVWLVDLRKELGVMAYQAAPSAPLVVDDLVFVLTGNAAHGTPPKVQNPSAPSFIAVDAKEGKIAWKDASPGDRILESQWGSPAYAVVEGQPQVAFPGGDGWLYSFEPRTGKLLWKFNCLAGMKAEEKNSLVAPPIFAGHRLLIAVGWDTESPSPPGCLRAIDARKRGDITATGELWRVTRTARAKDEEFGRSISSVTVLGGLVYAAEQQGYVNCIDLGSGKPLWSYDLLSSVWGAPLAADGKLYVRTGEGDTVVLQAGREAKLLAKNPLPDLQCGTVAAAGGVLYIAGQSKLYAIAQEK